MARRVLDWLIAQNKRGQHHVVAVNVSGHSIANTGFVAALHDLLRQYKAIRSQLMFEITESARIEDLGEANRFIQGLRQAGHEVCLDDFGAGSAALRYLHALEVDVVKIDGQYVRSALETGRNRAFLKAVTGLCHDLGIATIAEMIEDEPCAQMLRECRVRYGQGYMFGKPAFDVSEFASIPKRTPDPLPAAPVNSEMATVITPDQMRKQARPRPAAPEPAKAVGRRQSVRQDRW